MSRGMFIVLEGPEGGGKSTLAKKLHKAMNYAGHDTLLTREPGGTAVCDKLRSILLDPETKMQSELAVLFLFLTIRAEHVETKVKPAIKSGMHVICDRFSASTIAYQGDKFPVEMLKELDATVRQGITPDLTILLDLPVEVGMERNRSAGKNDRFEQETVEYHNRVRQRFLGLAKADPSRVLVIKADQHPELVYHEALRAIYSTIDRKRELANVLERFGM